MFRRTLLVASLVLALGGVVALVTAFAGSSTNNSAGPEPIPLSQASGLAPYVRSSITAAAAKAGLNAVNLSLAYGNDGLQGPGLVFGTTATGDVAWASETQHMNTSFLTASDELVRTPVYLLVATSGGSSSSIVSSIVGVFKDAAVSSVRLTQSDGSLSTVPASMWGHSGYSSFEQTTSPGISPTLLEATDSTGKVVYRKSFNVEAHCFDPGSNC